MKYLKNVISLKFLIIASMVFLSIVPAQAGGLYGLKVGDKAPDFKARTYDGKAVVLKDVVAIGPVVLVFYRGSWCPFCNLHLQAFERKLAEFKAAGISIIALSVDKPEASAKTVQQNKLGFAVVSEAAEAILRSYNVYGTAKHAGQVVAVPATYLVDSSQMIRYAFVNENPMVRSKPEQVLEAAKSLSGQ